MILLPFGSAHEEREGWELRGSYDHIAPKDVLDKTDTRNARESSRFLDSARVPGRSEGAKNTKSRSGETD